MLQQPQYEQQTHLVVDANASLHPTPCLLDVSSTIGCLAVHVVEHSVMLVIEHADASSRQCHLGGVFNVGAGVGHAAEWNSRDQLDLKLPCGCERHKKHTYQQVNLIAAAAAS